MSFLENMAVRTILRILPSPGARSRAEGDGRSDANQCCDMKADLATIGPEATLKARRCVGPERPWSWRDVDFSGRKTWNRTSFVLHGWFVDDGATGWIHLNRARAEFCDSRLGALQRTPATSHASSDVVAQ